jgi:transposase-like protein
MSKPKKKTDKLDITQIEAARMIAEADLTQREIARRLGVDEQTLSRWKHDPLFLAKIQEHTDELEDSIRRTFVAQRHKRIERLLAMVQRLETVMSERGLEFEDAQDLERSGGGHTGVVVRQYKSIGSGPTAEVRVEYMTDATLLREYRAYCEHLARELGQWGDKLEITGSGGGPIIVREVVVKTPELDLPEDY